MKPSERIREITEARIRALFDEYQKRYPQAFWDPSNYDFDRPEAVDVMRYLDEQHEAHVVAMNRTVAVFDNTKPGGER